MDSNPYAPPQIQHTTASETSVAQEGPRDWTISEVLTVGWNAVWKNPGTLIGGFTLVMFANQVAQGIVQSALVDSGDPAGPFEQLEHLAVSLPILLVLGTFFNIGQMRVALSAARGESIDFGLFFSGFDRLFVGVLLMLIIYAAVFLAAIPLIFPAVIVGLGWSMAIVLLADTTLSPREMLAESWAITRGQRLKLLLLAFASGAVVLIGLLALVIGILVAIPVVTIAFAEAYRCISGRRTKQI